MRMQIASYTREHGCQHRILLQKCCNTLHPAAHVHTRLGHIALMGLMLFGPKNCNLITTAGLSASRASRGKEEGAASTSCTCLCWCLSQCATFADELLLTAPLCPLQCCQSTMSTLTRAEPLGASCCSFRPPTLPAHQDPSPARGGPRGGGGRRGGGGGWRGVM